MHKSPNSGTYLKRHRLLHNNKKIFLTFGEKRSTWKIMRNKQIREKIANFVSRSENIKTILAER